MNVLEKILEEISEIEKEYVTGHKVLYALGAVGMATEISNIIRSHMEEGKDTNVGSKSDWIPCSERLPEETGYYLVQLSRKLPNEDYADRVVALYNAEEKEFMCYKKLIKAWQPIPEPYKGGKENE